jgi:outer membrane protein assembly factor BamB
VGAGWSSPVVVNDKVIFFHRVGDDEVLECLEATTGKEIWKKKYRTKYSDDFNFDEGPRATPLISAETVFTLGADGDLTAFSFKEGTQLWQRNINVDYQVPKGFFGVATSPMILGNHLLINVGGKGAGIVAFDPKSGKEIWKVSNQSVSYSSPVSTKIDNESLAIFFTRQGLFAVTPDKGEVRYEFEWRPRINSSVNAASPIVVGNQIFLSTSYSRGAILLEASKGELKKIWSGDDKMSCHYNTPVYFKDHLFGIEGRQEGGGELRCIEWKTGKIRWTEKNFGCASLILVDGKCLAMGENGDLVLFEPQAEEYKELARSSILDNPVRAAFALSNGRVFARDKTKLVCVEVKK